MMIPTVVRLTGLVPLNRRDTDSPADRDTGGQGQGRLSVDDGRRRNKKLSFMNRAFITIANGIYAQNYRSLFCLFNSNVEMINYIHLFTGSNLLKLVIQSLKISLRTFFNPDFFA
jgi:hypothetical protein